MNKTLFLFVLIALIPVALIAQKSPLSIAFSANYNLGIQKNSVETFNNTKIENNSSLVENKKFSLGQGPSIMGSLLFSASDHTSIVVGLRYSFLAKTEFTTESSVGTVSANGTRSLEASRFALLPALQLNTDNDKFNLYVRSGISVNFTNQKLIDINEVSSNIVEEQWKYTGKPSIGFYGGLGVQYNITRALKFTLGIEFENLSYEPTSASIVEYRKNNVESRHDYDPIDSEIEFNEWVEDQYSQNVDIEKPLQSPIQTFTYNSMGISLGIIYRL